MANTGSLILAEGHYPKFIVIKTRLLEQKGRKVKVSGTVEDLDGNLLVEAKYV